MHKHLRHAVPVAIIAAAALTLSACSAEPADEPDDGRTVTVENAKPTFVPNTEERPADGSYYDETVVDFSAPSEAVEVPYQPSRVVTFDLATLDTLDAIGAGDAVVGIPDAVLPDYLSDYAALPKVGTLFEPDFEAVAELDPDLIVTAARSSGAYDELAEIATAIDLTAVAGGTFDPGSGLERAAQLGAVFGAEDEVAARATEIEEKVAGIQAATADLGPALFLMVTGGEYGAVGDGAGSRFGYFFDVLGFTPAVPAAELPGAEGSPHGETVSNEFIYEVNPDWLLVLDRGAATGEAGEGAAEVLDNELVAETTAAQEGQILYLPPAELYLIISGLTAIDNVLDTVADAIG